MWQNRTSWDFIVPLQKVHDWKHELIISGIFHLVVYRWLWVIETVGGEISDRWMSVLNPTLGVKTWVWLVCQKTFIYKISRGADFLGGLFATPLLDSECSCGPLLGWVVDHAKVCIWRNIFFLSAYRSQFARDSQKKKCVKIQLWK